MCVRAQVKAAKLGHILVIDEADKAPTNVTSILKTLVESGEMILADGRRIVSGSVRIVAPSLARKVKGHHLLSTATVRCVL